MLILDSKLVVDKAKKNSDITIHFKWDEEKQAHVEVWRTPTLKLVPKQTCIICFNETCSCKF